ncbi:MAG: metallophosphoesterase, partial [Clostridia bacterium]|nr:metallophosphoesterase [Clostridia bacterium]
SGNHEAALSWDDYHSLTRRMRAPGVQVLEDQAVAISRGGTDIQLIGLKDLGFIPGSIPERRQEVANTLRLFARDDMFTLVLSHRPELMDEYAQAPCELVLCGHAHGGQVRLPLIGGLFSPGQGLFPKYDAGFYFEGGTAMYLSRGIGNSNFPLRFNNRPELVLIELKAVPAGS